MEVLEGQEVMGWVGVVDTFTTKLSSDFLLFTDLYLALGKQLTMLSDHVWQCLGICTHAEDRTQFRSMLDKHLTVLYF